MAPTRIASSPRRPCRGSIPSQDVTANATPAAARAGWEIFKANAFRGSLDEINAALAQAGFGPVSNRMLRHYRQLASAGYDHYVSINRFDVARAAKAYEGASADSRYLYHRTAAPVRVTFVRHDEFYEAFGTASEISEVGAYIAFEDSAVSISITKSKLGTGDPLLVAFLDPPASSAARVVEVDRTDEDHVMIEVEFTRLQSIVGYVGDEALAASRYRVELLSSDSDALTADVVGRRIYYLLDAVDASRSAVNALLQESESGFYASPTQLDSLRVESPLLAVLGVPELVAAVFLGASASLGVYIKWQKARLSRNDADFRGEEVREKRIQNDLAELRADTLKRLHSALQEEIGDTPAGLDRAALVLERHTFPAIEKLATQGVEAINISETPSERSPGAER